MKRTKSAILFQGTVELGLVRDADLDSEKLRNRFIEKVCECFQTSPRESQWPDRLQIEREPYCRQFNDLAWRKKTGKETKFSKSIHSRYVWFEEKDQMVELAKSRNLHRLKFLHL